MVRDMVGVRVKALDRASVRDRISIRVEVSVRVSIRLSATGGPGAG